MKKEKKYEKLDLILVMIITAFITFCITKAAFGSDWSLFNITVTGQKDYTYDELEDKYEELKSEYEDLEERVHMAICEFEDRKMNKACNIMYEYLYDMPPM